jgi:aspartyl-tRNA(Asn)/glutamyl-tRNA(Gln) amidotransferase subunit B
MNLEPVIGLEIHIQLKTKSKMFCACAAHENALTPNTNVCPICLGHPGVLPVPNKEAIRAGVRMGLALNCEIAAHSKFDRKNYFYPDLPKAYQISQFDLPIAKEGFVDIIIPNGKIRTEARIGITRAHLEEDAAKNIHGKAGKTFVDFNRGGTPLVEIVTEPDFTTPQEAKIFLQELRLIARYLGISDADMEKGHLRCDANISLRKYDNKGNLEGLKLNPKTEVKNINSFKHVERALEYEIKRQTELWLNNAPPAESTTRGWNDNKGVTENQRSKEGAQDYRYFPEPDIPPLVLEEIVEDLKGEIPELPAAKRTRFVEEYKLKHEHARQICENIALANFVEHTFSELEAWLNSLPELDDAQEKQYEAERKKLAKLIATWTLTKLNGLLSERSSDIRIAKINPENFAEFLKLIATKQLNAAAGLEVLGAMLDDGSDPSHIMEERGLGAMQDESELAEVVSRVIESHPEELLRYQNGEKQLMKFFIGQVMKETQGTADAGMTANMIKVKLEG